MRSSFSGTITFGGRNRASNLPVTEAKTGEKSLEWKMKRLKARPVMRIAEKSLMRNTFLWILETENTFSFISRKI